jgi:hypothetical protein
MRRVGFARNSPVPGIPLLCDLIPLLFRCYSPVNSAVIPLLIPLLLCCQRSGFIPQIPESAHVFETGFSQETAESDFFPVNRGFQISSRPRIVHGKPPWSRVSGAGDARKTRIMPAPPCASRLDPGTGMTDGGLDSVVFGRCLGSFGEPASPRCARAPPRYKERRRRARA